jgi:ATP-dependent protease ClpP protease subunit
MKKYDQYTAADKIDAHLHDNDIHYLTGEISQDNVEEAIKWILSANLSKKPKKTLKLYINTVGGDLYESFALIDVMKNSYHHISTIGIGAVMSAGLLIFASGKQGERYIGKNTGILNHQKYSLSDVRKKLNTPSDQYFTAKQMIDLKLADHIL